MRFLVFSDDWGRHPSSCQHLIRQLLPEHEVTWVNTIGMRPPRLDAITLRRGLEKLGNWSKRATRSEKRATRRERRAASGEKRGDGNTRASRLAPRNSSHQSPSAEPTVIDATMWPWFSHRWDRWLNRKLLCRQLRGVAEDAIAITTIPIVADLVGELPVRKWVYYCVDDFSVWPGLDGRLLGQMEDELVAKVDCTLAVSDTLMESLQRRGRDPLLLTHGVDLEFWRNELREASGEKRDASGEKIELSPGEENSPLVARFSPLPSDSPLGTRNSSPTSRLDPSASQVPSSSHSRLAPRNSPLILFWGVVDRRMNADWVLALADRLGDGQIVLAGPQQDPDERLLQHPRIELPGPQPFERLPELAAEAAVLIMPYADLPVTRAMQPLKLKEYLATGRPVVVSDLPATRDWADGLQVVGSEAEFVDQVLRLLANPVCDAFAANPALADRLRAESWSAKAERMLAWVARGE